jgi:hypothetical protein
MCFSRFARRCDLILNGKRFFPLGLYAKPTGPDPYKQMAEAGFNLVSSGFDKEALDAAARAGIYCWIPLGEAMDLSSYIQIYMRRKS